MGCLLLLFSESSGVRAAPYHTRKNGADCASEVQGLGLLPPVLSQSSELLPKAERLEDHARVLFILAGVRPGSGGSAPNQKPEAGDRKEPRSCSPCPWS